MTQRCQAARNERGDEPVEGRDYEAPLEFVRTDCGREIERRQVLIERGTPRDEPVQVFITGCTDAHLTTITPEERQRWQEARPRWSASDHVYRAWERVTNGRYLETRRDPQGQTWGLMHTRHVHSGRPLAEALIDTLAQEKAAMDLIVATCGELRNAAGGQARGVSRNCGEVRLKAPIQPSGKGLEGAE